MSSPRSSLIVFQRVQLVPVDQGDRDALLAGPAGAADPVDVGLGVLRALVVDHVRDVGDVDAAGGDVGGHQHVDLAGAERAQRLLAGALAQVAVHGGGGEPAVGEVVGHPLHGALGPREDHGQAAVLGLQHPGEQLDLVHRVRPVDQLPGALVDGALVGLLGADVRGPVQERAGQRDDRAGHGGREEHGVPLLGQHPHDPLDVGQEAQVEHLVGLVEDQGLDPAEHQVALLGEVEQPAGGADDRRRRPCAARPAAARRPGRRRSAVTRMPRCLPASAMSLATCTHSSRVGTTTRACGTSLVRSAASPSTFAAGCSDGGTTRCSSGTPKPSVLPMPVRAWPMMSSPASASGRVSSWMAKVRTMPASASAAHDLGADAQLGEGGGLLLDGGAGLQRVGLDEQVGRCSRSRRLGALGGRCSRCQCSRGSCRSRRTG